MRGVGRPQTAIYVRRKSGVLEPFYDFDVLDRLQRSDVLGTARIIGNDDVHAPAVGGAPDAFDERCDQVCVAVARNDDRDRSALTAVPAHR